MTLHGHLDEEIVIDIADGRHRGDTARCDKCALLQMIEQELRNVKIIWKMQFRYGFRLKTGL